MEKNRKTLSNRITKKKAYADSELLWARTASGQISPHGYGKELRSRMAAAGATGRALGMSARLWGPGSPWGDRQRTWSTAASTRLPWPLHCQTLNTRYAAVGILVITHLGASFLLRHTSLGTYCSPHPDTARTLLAWESTSPARSFFPL